MSEPVVITGRSLATALGRGLDETWASLLAGRSGIGAIEGFDASGFPCQSAACVSGIDEQSLDLPRRESRIMDLHSFILMKCATEAMADSGLQQHEDAAADTGFFAAIGMVDYRQEDLTGAVSASRDEQGGIDYDKFYEQNFRDIFPLWPLSMLNNIALCQVAVRLGLRGENTVFSPHGDSAIQAVAEAAATVEEGGNSAVLAGGVGEKVSESSLARGLLHGMLNTRDRVDPCRPFSTDRAGGVLGEGGGVVLLESRTRAEARGTAATAAVGGYGSSFGLADPADATTGPSADAIRRAMGLAVERAGRRPEEVDLVIAHGDGTPEGDSQEWEAISGLFSGADSMTRLYSSKGALGNLLGGAPIVDLILAERMIRTGLIPATYGADDTDNIAGSMLVRGQPLEARPRVILINGFSYEGQAGSLLLEAL
jgi:3-oxoacyl-[acyl-carrier-protein] synthase II